MARLNEPPIAPAPSVDILDAVKRRYLRQNRELARTNSQQSMRIRTLENDASRLLAENLSLREQVLQLQSALEAQSYRPSFETIESMKSQLETKLQELGGLVAEFGQLKKKDQDLPRCKSQTAATRRSPDERQWRSGLGLQEVENAMLPTIVEDKHYPRQTMNSDELRDMLEARDSQSPDIGPPPVSRFDDQEPILFNATVQAEERTTEPIEDQEPVLPITLETRRKRRESGPRLDVRSVPIPESPPNETVKTNPTAIRVGAKRKFSVQEDEEKAPPPAESFRFSRRNISMPPEDSESTETPRPLSPERPVLSSKPVNTDPVLSPKKQRSSALGKSEKLEKKPLTKTVRSRLTITRDIQPELPSVELPPPIPVAEVRVDERPPKTPAAELIFSPATTETSVSRVESKDTPPPGDLSNAASMGGRPSRRARPQVSYKEPPLNTKMRRPGKELVDAVNPEHASRTSVESQSLPPSVSKATTSQQRDGSAWKFAGSRSIGRMTEEISEAASPLRQKLDRKEGQGVKIEGLQGNTSTTDAISTKTSETNTTKRRLPTAAPQVAHESESNCITVASRQFTTQKDDLAVFEFNESSPINDGKAPTSSNYSHSRTELAKTARTARRHSSVPISANSEDTNTELSTRTEKVDGASSSMHKRTGSGTARSSGTSTQAKNVAASRTSMKEREKKNPALSSNANTTSGTLKGESDGMGNAKAERAAHRRKSMIV